MNARFDHRLFLHHLAILTITKISLLVIGVPRLNTQVPGRKTCVKSHAEFREYLLTGFALPSKAIKDGLINSPSKASWVMLLYLPDEKAMAFLSLVLHSKV